MYLLISFHEPPLTTLVFLFGNGIFFKFCDKKTGNVVPKIDTIIKPDKEKSTEKIDGAVATIMALDRAIRHQSSGGESVYNERGLLIL